MSARAPASPLTDLDPTLTAPKRLAAVALLTRSATADFATLRAHLGVSESDLSKQMAALAAAGHVSVRKSGRGRGSTTTYRVTRSGRAAYARHRAALEAILAGDPGPSDGPGNGTVGTA